MMGDPTPPTSYYSSFEPPSVAITLRAKKRALGDRISSTNLAASSPKKRPRGGTCSPKSSRQRKRPFAAAPPPPDEDVTNEDSLSLLDLFSASVANKGSTKQQQLERPGSLSSSHSPPQLSSLSSSPSSSSAPLGGGGVGGCFPTNSSNNKSISQPPPKPRSQPPSYLDLIQTPPQLKPATTHRKRQQLTPAPLLSSGTTGGSSSKANPFQLGGAPRANLKVNLKDRFADEADSCAPEESEWSPLLCLDWSLKTKLTLLSSQPFGFHSSAAGLKSSEESSGTSAFARCIDIDPSGKHGNDGSNSSSNSPLGSQLDTSLGAQFHQCCLYWQHPTLPAVDLFPREHGNGGSSGISFSFAASTGPSSSAPLGGIRMEQKVMDAMFLEWVDSFRSVFQLLRTRQCPYFYICTNQFTCLFSAAGTQGLEYLQVYIAPSNKGFRDALNHEGIEFTTPCSSSSEIIPESNKQKSGKVSKDEDDESDEEPNKWLDEMGISQDVSLSHSIKTSPGTTADEKNKSSLVVIVGTNTLAFFNLLINSKNLLVSSTGTFAGLPPTILCPVAFHGATLKQLKVKQTRSGGKDNIPSYSIEMVGPILPHVIHMLCPVVKKIVQNFRIRMTSLGSTINLNLNSRYNSSATRHVRMNAFELQNLSDCGLRKRVLEAFCRSENVDTISSTIECKDGLFRWS